MKKETEEEKQKRQKSERKMRYVMLRLSFGIPCLFVIAVAVALEILGLQSLRGANDQMGQTYKTHILASVTQDVWYAQLPSADMALRTCREFQEQWLQTTFDDSAMLSRILIHFIHQFDDFVSVTSTTVYTNQGQYITITRDPNSDNFQVTWQLSKMAQGQSFVVNEVTAYNPPQNPTTVPNVAVEKDDWVIQLQNLGLGKSDSCYQSPLGATMLGSKVNGVVGSVNAGVFTVVLYDGTIFNTAVDLRISGSIAFISTVPQPGTSLNQAKLMATIPPTNVIGSDGKQRTLAQIGNSNLAGAVTELQKRLDSTVVSVSLPEFRSNQYSLYARKTPNSTYLIAILFNEKEMIKYSDEAEQNFLQITIPVLIVCVGVSAIISVVSYYPVAKVKSTLEEQGHDVVKWYKELNKENTKKMQTDNVVKFSTEPIHGSH
eukprot:PhF_6_TR11040/c0_g1_i2/m.17913